MDSWQHAASLTGTFTFASSFTVAIQQSLIWPVSQLSVIDIRTLILMDVLTWPLQLIMGAVDSTGTIAMVRSRTVPNNVDFALKW